MSIRKFAQVVALSSFVFASFAPSAISAPVPQNGGASKQHKLSSAKSQVEFLNGTWQGTYICNQGLTNLKLVINAKSPTDINAVFLFSAHASNPTVPSGAFRMTGTYSIFNSTEIPNTLELKATNWINQPSSYITVNLQGNVLSDEKRIVGNVNTPGCTKFDVVKVKQNS